MYFEKKGSGSEYFNDIKFLINAVSDDKVRLFMNCINIETDNDIVYMAATNGRILHFVEYKKDDFPLDDGMYEIKINQKEVVSLERNDELGEFPNWKLFFCKENIKVIKNYIFRENKKNHDDYSFYKLNFILSNLGYCINYTYLKYLYDIGLSWDIYLNPYKQNSALKFVSANYTAVIMPIGVQDDCIPIIQSAFSLLDKTLKSVSDNTE